MPVRAETRARALALQLLYARAMQGENGDAARSRETVYHGVLRLSGVGPRVQERALQLADDVVRDGAGLDAHIKKAAKHWRLERLAAVDLAILRLGVLELLEGHTPPKVVLDESIRLARWFGGEKSPAFVNGVLDGVARELGKL